MKARRQKLPTTEELRRAHLAAHQAYEVARTTASLSYRYRGYLHPKSVALGERYWDARIAAQKAWFLYLAATQETT